MTSRVLRTEREVCAESSDMDFTQRQASALAEQLPVLRQ